MHGAPSKAPWPWCVFMHGLLFKSGTVQRLNNFAFIKYALEQERNQGPDFLGTSSFKGCRATSPPCKFKILYRVSEILKNRGSPILEVWARRIARPSSL